ncbi:MAG: VRR-NUC domain-containing protein [Gemmatimonadaceae bacterium]
MGVSPSDILRIPWVQALRPRGEPYCAGLSRYSEFLAWHVDIGFTLWPITPEQQLKWKVDKANNDETWRKRPLVVGEDSGCGPFSCGEVEVAARLKKAGFNAKWVSEWSGYQHVECWRRYCVKRSDLEDEEPELWAADYNLRMKAGVIGDQLGKRGGHPDVAAWRSQDDIVYVEYKGPTDSINEKQDIWARELIRQNPKRFCYLAAHGVINPAG